MTLGPAWPEESVVYDAATARTHIITTDAMAVLRALAAMPDDATGLAAKLAVDADDDGLDAVLLEFGRLGIVTTQSD